MAAGLGVNVKWAGVEDGVINSLRSSGFIEWFIRR